MQQTDADGMNSLGAHFQHQMAVRVCSFWTICLGVQTEGFAATILWKPAVQSTSDGLTKILMQLQGCEASACRKPQSLRKENHSQGRSSLLTRQGRGKVVLWSVLSGDEESLWGLLETYLFFK